MKIYSHPINSFNKTSFKAVYRLPYTEKDRKEIEEKILPNYRMVSNQNVGYFVGKNPFFEAINAFVQYLANEHSSSVSWLKMNAENHGADLSGLKEDFIYVFTGDKDVPSFIDYYTKRKTHVEKESLALINVDNSFIGRIKRLFLSHEKIDQGFDENTPEHLKPLFYVIKKDKEETELFKEFCPNPTDVKTTKDLFFKMLNER